MITAIAFDGNGVLYYRQKDFTYALMEYIKARHMPDFDVEGGAADHLRFMRQSFDGAIGKAEAMRLFLDSVGITHPEMRADISRKGNRVLEGYQPFSRQRRKRSWSSSAEASSSG